MFFNWLVLIENCGRKELRQHVNPEHDFDGFPNSTELGNIPKQEHVEMLYPTGLVRVGKSGSGSGTVVYSKLDEDKKY